MNRNELNYIVIVALVLAIVIVVAIVLFGRPS